MAFDLVIRGGEVVDGTGLPRYRADVGVRGGRIVAIGRIGERGAEEVDAEGHVVTPGFIDSHTHMDAQVLWDPLGTCSCYHGVTSVVMGNCGFTLAPSRAHERHLVVRNLERAEDISADAMAAGIEWTWETFPEYLDTLDRTPKGINYAAHVGHSALRTWAMGERAFEEEATADDLALMAGQLRDALRAGALGFTTSRSPNHQTADDRPVASRLASWAEVAALVGVMGELGTGVFEIAQEPVMGRKDPRRAGRFLPSHAASWRWTPVCPSPSGSFPGPEMDRTGRVSSSSSTPPPGPGVRCLPRPTPGSLPSSCRGRPGCPSTSCRSGGSCGPSPWATRSAISRTRLCRRAWWRPPATATTVAAIGAETRRPDYDWIRILERPVPPNPTVAQRAAETGRDPVQVMIDLALATDFDQLFTQVIANRDPDSVLSIMRHPRALVTFSDSGAHVSQIMDSSLQTHLLAHWVRDQQAFTLEEAVRNLTLAPATAWHFADRGLVREGFVADLNVIDPERVAPTMPEVVSDLPGGAKRLVQTATGIRSTIVAGEEVLVDGKPTGALPGVVLRARQAS